jgi:glycosyltransferase involved in cell wall biosynthesis
MRLRIAVASTFGWPYVRRGSRCPYELASYLARRGHEVYYITTKPGIRSRTNEKDGFSLEYHRLMKSPFLSLIRAQNLDSFILPCLRSILRHDVDIVQTFLPMDAFAASMVKAIKGTSFVHFMIDRFQPHYYITGYGKFMLRRGIQQAARVTAVSNFVIADLKNQFGIDATLTPPPVDTDQFTLCEGKDLQNPRILYTSSLHDPRKGFMLLVKAFEKLLDSIPNARLQLSGHVHPSAVKAIDESVSQRTRRSIDILGVGKREDLPELYRQAAVTVLPSVNEAFGMVLTESLASGTPVVGSKSGGVLDVITNTQVGSLFDPDGGAEGLCKALLRGLELTQDPDVWKKCRNHAESFSWNRVGPRFENVYSEVIDSRKNAVSHKHVKYRDIPKNSPEQEIIPDRPKGRLLSRVFDDALDGLEIDYDNYYKVDRFKPWCTYILNWLLSNGIRTGNILVVGCYTLPLRMLLKKFGFTVKGIGMTVGREPWNDNGNEMRLRDLSILKDEKGSYDVIICDDISHAIQYSGRIMQIFRDILNTEGLLIMTTREAKDRRSRFLPGNGNAILDLAEGSTNEANSPGGEKRLAAYHEFNLGKVEKLVCDAGFSVDQRSYIIKEKAIEGSLFPIPVYSYFCKKVSYCARKIMPSLRNDIFIAARRGSLQ